MEDEFSTLLEFDSKNPLEVDSRSKIESVIDYFIFPSLTDIVLNYSHTQKFSEEFLKDLRCNTFELLRGTDTTWDDKIDFSIITHELYIICKWNRWKDSYRIHLIYPVDLVVERRFNSRHKLICRKRIQDDINNLGKCMITNRCYMRY